MTEELKTLIDKIQQEGVEAGQKKAWEIEKQAAQKADETIGKAQALAQKFLEEARQRIKQDEVSSEATLRQAARDIVLSLKAQILATLDKLMAAQAGKAQSSAHLAEWITLLVKQAKVSGAGPVIVTLKPEDAMRLEEGFLEQLKEELKKDIVLKRSQDISGGFVISFDAGKSHFDFTDKALAEHLAQVVRPRLAELLDEGPR
jgi:V/A-type H+-transporting ATPase subunit E